MQIFDFTNGTKGKLVGEAKRCQYSGGWIVVKNDTRFKVTLTNPPNLGDDATVDWCAAAGSADRDGNDVDLNPADFGCSAIIFCLGEYYIQWHPGHPEAVTEWQWRVVGTPEWNREACRKGILTAEKLGPAFKNNAA